MKQNWLLVGIVLVELSAFASREVVVAEKTGVAIQRAINEVVAEGGGRVTLANGVYESATLYLKSGIDLHLEKGAVLRGGGEAGGLRRCGRSARQEGA